MPKIAAIILAGGKASRLSGQNKCELMIGDKSCLTLALELFDGVVDQTVISVGNKDRHGHGKSHHIVFDWPYKAARPAVAFAILGSLDWAQKSGFDAILTAPVDTPFLPKTFAARLKQHFNPKIPAVCKTADGLQGLHAIWPVHCLNHLKTAIVSENRLKISALHDRLQSIQIKFENGAASQFYNINDQVDLENARLRWAEASSGH